MDLAQIFKNQVEINKDNVAYTFLVDGEDKTQTFSYSELSEKVKSIAVDIQEKYQQGDRVILLFDTGLDFIASLWACFLAGVIAVPVHPPMDMRGITKLLNIVKDSKPSLVLTTSSFVSQMIFFESSMPDLPKIDKIAIDLVQNKSSEFKDINFSEQTNALIQYTSGSVGLSKGVLLTHGNIIHNAQMLKAVLDEIPPPNANKDSFLCWLPLYHDMGLMSGVILPLVMGTNSTLMSPLMFLQKPYRWLKALSKYKATVSAAPNFAYELCIKKTKDEQLKELDLSSWSVALNGAEPIRSETIKKFTEKFKDSGFTDQAFFPAYGLAESVVFVTGPSRDQLPVILEIDKNALENNKISISENTPKVSIVTTGHIWLDETVLIVNPETFEISKPDEIGEIWISGQSIAIQYWNLDEETDNTFNAQVKKGNEILDEYKDKKFLKTGDLGFFKGENLFITGRIKDLIIIRGHNYYPHHIEQGVESFSEHFRPGSNAAFSITNDGEEKLIVIQEVKKDAKIDDIDNLKNQVKTDVIQKHGIILHDIVFLKQGSIFKTSSGKVQRRMSKNKYLKKGLELWKN